MRRATRVMRPSCPADGVAERQVAERRAVERWTVKTNARPQASPQSWLNRRADVVTYAPNPTTCAWDRGSSRVFAPNAATAPVTCSPHPLSRNFNHRPLNESQISWYCANISPTFPASI
ncbi:hypothetical protein Lesp01_78550 [Lentzea sp. NBRC 102530]|nr:hypothetical protein Lesp01_78550 [Lentzea sp. NBRC 102530]